MNLINTKAHLAIAIALALVWGMLVATSAIASAEEMYPNKVQTHIGELNFDHGVPTKETSEKLYYELEYHRAVQAYLWSLPIMGQTQWRQSYLDAYDIKPNQMVFAKQFNERSQILTANESTPYLFGWTNVKEKAAIIEVPPGMLIGLIIDFWQRGLGDTGIFGPNAGKGETIVLSGPETPEDQIPYIEGAIHIKSQTNNIWFLYRVNTKPEERDALASKILTGYHGEELRSQIIDGQNKVGRNFQPRGMKYWEMLHMILQEEPVAERDRFFMYFLKEMGIEKGKPFNPTEHQKKIMTDAIVVGEAMAKNFVFRERLPGVLRDDGWRLILGRVEGSEPGDAQEHTQRAKYFDRFDPRARYTYEACTTSPKIVYPKVGQGMGYGGMFLDSKERAMAGDRSYVINVPADPPVEIFWAITVYDVDTRGMVRTDQERAERGSRHEGIRMNEDGSTPIFVGPEAPKGWENNWIKSIPGRAWFPYFRFYGPKKAYFDQSWKLPQIEEVDYATYGK
jgi:hypothetical protein